MLLEVGLVAIGVPFGWLSRKSATAQKTVGHILTWVVRLLLLVLGISLGADSHLMSQLESLGLQAAAISLCAIAGSLAAAWLLNRLLNLAPASFPEKEANRS